MFLYIVRHGDPDYTTDTLTERGKLQAEAVAKRLADAGINRVFSSPLGRARETAAPTCRLLGLDCTIEEWTREIDEETYTPFPDGIPKSVSTIQSTYYRENGNIDLDYQHAFECQGFCDSGMDRALKNISEGGDAFLERLGYRAENGNYRILRPNQEKVALFCHGAMGRVFIASLLHIPLHLMWAGFRYTHTGVTVIEFKNNENGITAPACLCYSDMSHLYAAGPDMLYNSTKHI
ncbi:MAG: histidine phosphatase family protein [Ruminococcaceae bacterium]|nr:histidine phosphatase family protein [Oscillospiraceae bacterium]